MKLKFEKGMLINTDKEWLQKRRKMSTWIFFYALMLAVGLSKLYFMYRDNSWEIMDIIIAIICILSGLYMILDMFYLVYLRKTNGHNT